jgi:hypothetical protein
MLSTTMVLVQKMRFMVIAGPQSIHEKATPPKPCIANEIWHPVAHLKISEKKRRHG